MSMAAEVPAQMRAVICHGPENYTLEEIPVPAPGPGEVVIASRASAICGSDLHGFREASPRRIPPLVMGHETVGEIADVGDGVEQYGLRLRRQTEDAGGVPIR